MLIYNFFDSMMHSKKKPDNVVFNETSQRYVASIKPYATNLGAPKIKPTDSIAWKNRSIHKLNQKLETRFNELKNQYDLLVQEFEFNKLINQAQFTFEPIMGQTYHLYKRKNGETFLSILAPNECNFNFLGSFLLNTDEIWEKVAVK